MRTAKAMVLKDEFTKEQLSTAVHQLEVACEELKSLPLERSVYQKRGTIFFRSNIKTLINSQQKELDKSKSRLKKAVTFEAPNSNLEKN